MRPSDFKISDSDAEKMPILFQQLRLAYNNWEKTGKLPNGQEWQKNTERAINEECK